MSDLPISGGEVHDNPGEIIEAAERLLGERFDPALSLEELCELFGHVFLQGGMAADACERDVELLWTALAESELPQVPEHPPLFRGERKVPDFLKPFGIAKEKSG